MRKHLAISPSRRLGHLHRSCGYLFPHTHPQRLPKMSSISDHIPIPVTAVWPFSSTLGIHQDDRNQNAGTRDGHQSLSVPGLLAHLFTISRPVPPRHYTSAQSLPHDGPPHTRQEVRTDPKTEMPFFWDTSSTWFPSRPSRSLQLWIDIPNQALICSFLISQGGCAHMWHILLSFLHPQTK